MTIISFNMKSAVKLEMKSTENAETEDSKQNKNIKLFTSTSLPKRFMPKKVHTSANRREKLYRKESVDTLNVSPELREVIGRGENRVLGDTHSIKHIAEPFVSDDDLLLDYDEVVNFEDFARSGEIDLETEKPPRPKKRMDHRRFRETVNDNIERIVGTKEDHSLADNVMVFRNKFLQRNEMNPFDKSLRTFQDSETSRLSSLSGSSSSSWGPSSFEDNNMKLVYKEKKNPKISNITEITEKIAKKTITRNVILRNRSRSFEDIDLIR